MFVIISVISGEYCIYGCLGDWVARKGVSSPVPFAWVVLYGELEGESALLQILNAGIWDRA